MSTHNEIYQEDPQNFRDIYSVSRLTREARALLEGSFPLLWIEGEISNFARPASGHWYFSLKDDLAQVRCAMFRNRNMLAGFVPQNGMQVLVRVRISMYEARGEFQIIAEHIEPAGDGALRREFELLKQRLQAEGLFAAEHKQPLPSSINRIGVITSPSGAAIRDILTTLKRRFPAAAVIIYPVAVQGNESAPQIVRMLQIAEQRNECDALILARGGGSLEDLWSFNDERVARAVYACALPIVSGIGHEVDFTIADMVADIRAATPTAAAELISPNQLELHTKIRQQTSRLNAAMQSGLRQAQQHLKWMQSRLPNPQQQVLQLTQRIDDYQQRMVMNMSHQLRHTRSGLSNFINKLYALHPGNAIKQQQQVLTHLSHRLETQIGNLLEKKHNQLKQAAHTLDAVSPLATLERGYAIVTNIENNSVITRASQSRPGDRIKARLHHGELTCLVEKINET